MERGCRLNKSDLVARKDMQASEEQKIEEQYAQQRAEGSYTENLPCLKAAEQFSGMLDHLNL